MQKISHNGLEFDVGKRSRYLICLPVYSSGGVEVLVRPFSDVYVVLENGRKVRDAAEISEILRKHGGILQNIDDMKSCSETLGVLPSIPNY